MGLLALLLLAIWVCARTKPYQPTPSQAPTRRAIVGLAVVANVILLLSLTRVWWVFEDPQQEYVEIIELGSAAEVPAIVASGSLTNLATVVALRGRRNWAPLPLLPAWLVLAWGWIASDGLGDSSGEVRSGLRLGTLAILLTTLAVVIGSANRTRERRQAASAS